MRMNQKVFILSTVVKYSVYAMTKDTNTIQIYITLQASQSLVIFLCNARVQLHRQRFRVTEYGRKIHSSDKNAILSLLSLYLGLFRDDLGRKYGMLKMLKQYTGTGYLNYVILFAGLRAR